MHKFSGEKRERNDIFNSQIKSPVAEICSKRLRGATETLVH